MKTKVLFIEDEKHLAKIVTDTLQLKGYEVLHQFDGTNVMESIKDFLPDICLLDVMLPYIDGFSIGSAVRNIFPDLPIIYITAKSQTQDVLTGFSSGGTDYIRKPFSMEELMVRIDNQILLKKDISKTAVQEVYSLGNINYYPLKLELHIHQKVIRLSNREAEIMNVLCRYPNQIIERKKLLQIVWGDDSFFNSRNLDVYIRRLRNYFTHAPEVKIITLKGVGYQFVVA